MTFQSCDRFPEKVIFQLFEKNGARAVGITFRIRGADNFSINPGEYLIAKRPSLLPIPVAVQFIEPLCTGLMNQATTKPGLM